MLVRVPFEKGRIGSVFQHLPVLEQLHTHWTQIAVNNEFFSILQYNEDEAAGYSATMTATSNHKPPLLPRLHTLVICDDAPYDHTSFPNDVTSAIISRWWSDDELRIKRPYVARWKEVHIIWDKKS